MLLLKTLQRAMTLLLVAGLASSSGVAAGWGPVQAWSHPTLGDDQAIVPESRFVRHILDDESDVLTETHWLVEQTMPIRANSYGNKGDAMRIRKEQLGSEIAQLVGELQQGKFYYGFNAEEIRLLKKALERMDVPFVFEGATLEQEIEMGAVTGPFVIGRMKKGGPLVIRLQENSFSMWKYEGLRNESAILHGPRKDMLDRAFMIAARELTGTESIWAALREEPRLADVVIEIRSHHHWVGETLHQSWDGKRFILHASVFENQSLLVGVMIEELSHVLTKKEDDIPFVAENVRHWIHVVGIAGVRQGLEPVSGLAKRLSPAFRAAERTLHIPLKPGAAEHDLQQRDNAILEKLSFDIATAIVNEQPSLLLGTIAMEDRQNGDTGKTIMDALERYPPFNMASAEMIRSLLLLPSLGNDALQFALNQLIAKGSLFRIYGRRETLYSLRSISRYPDRGPWTRTNMSLLKTHIVDEMYKHGRPVTQPLLRFFFQDFTLHAPYYHTALKSLMLHDEVSRSGTPKNYLYTLTDKGLANASRRAA